MSKIKHGDRVTCEILGRHIEDARINLNHKFPTICQNIIDGGEKCDHLGYNFSYSFRYIGDIKNLKLKEKTLDDLKVGDVLVRKVVFDKSYERKVLAICGLVYVLSGVDSFTECDCGYTIEEIKDMYTLKQEEEPEEEPEELTMAQLEKELGRKVKIIK